MHKEVFQLFLRSTNVKDRLRIGQYHSSKGPDQIEHQQALEKSIRSPKSSR